MVYADKLSTLCKNNAKIAAKYTMHKHFMHSPKTLCSQKNSMHAGFYANWCVSSKVQMDMNFMHHRVADEMNKIT